MTSTVNGSSTALNCCSTANRKAGSGSTASIINAHCTNSLPPLINRGFTPRMVAKLEQVFREITTAAIDAVAQKGECDFVTDIAVPLPLLLIAEMIGIRREDRTGSTTGPTR